MIDSTSCIIFSDSIDQLKMGADFICDQLEMGADSTKLKWYKTVIY